MLFAVKTLYLRKILANHNKDYSVVKTFRVAQVTLFFVIVSVAQAKCPVLEAVGQNFRRRPTKLSSPGDENCDAMRQSFHRTVCALVCHCGERAYGATTGC